MAARLLILEKVADARWHQQHQQHQQWQAASCSGVCEDFGDGTPSLEDFTTRIQYNILKKAA